MKRLFLLIAAAPLAAWAGDRTVSRKVPAFEGVRSELAADVDIQVGRPRSLTLTADPETLKHVVARVEGGILVLSTDARIHRNQRIRISVSTPALNLAQLDGAGSMNLRGINAKRLRLEMNGAGDILAEGKVSLLEASFNGAGNLRAYRLKANQVVADLNGAGRMEVWAVSSLHGKLTGAGDLLYRGNPPVIESIAKGAGRIKKGR